MEQPNLNAKLVDGVVTHSVNLLRVAAGQRKAVLAMLQKLEATLAAEIDTAASKNKSALTQARLKALLAQTKETIGSAYTKIADTTGAELAKVAQLEAVKTVNIINGAIGVGVATVGQSAEQLTAIAGKSIVHGKYPAEWWAKQSEDLQGKFADQMRMGMLKGEGVPDLVRRVRGTKAKAYTDGLMLVSKRQAEALVRTSVQTVANEARIATYLKNPTLIKGIAWVATLDSRTTPICRALDGLQWSLPGFEAVGHDKVFPGPVAHWQCRSTQVSVVRSWAELAGPKSKLKKDGKPIDLDAALQKSLIAKGMAPEQAAKVKAETKASMDGQVAASLKFEDWLKGKPDEFVDALLGPQRSQLWREGKVSLQEMTDQNNRPLTIAELKALIEANVDVPKQKPAGEFAPLAEKPAPFFDPKKEAEAKAAAEKAAAEAAAAQAKLQAEKEAAEKAAALKAANDAAQKVIDDAYGKFDPVSTAIVEINEANATRGTLSQSEIIDAAEKQVAQQAEAKAAKAAADAKAKAEAEAKAAADAAAKAAAEQAAAEAIAKAAADAEAKLHAEAQATIGEILANPAGQTLKAKAIGELMKKEPTLKPADLLAKAHEQAQEAAKKSSIASALNGAKKKMLAGEPVSKYQAEVIAALPPDQHAAFMGGVQSEMLALEAAKAAAEAAKAAAEAAAKKAADDAAKAAADAFAKNIASAQQKAVEAHLAGFSAQITVGFTPAEFDAWNKLSPKEKIAFNKEAKTKAGIPAAPKLPPKPAPIAAPIPTTPQPTPPPIAPVNEGAFPITPGGLQVVKGLGGSTGAQLVRDPDTGTLYVRKAGAKPEHVREEMTADRVYAIAGAPVPDGRLYDTAAGPVKLTLYLDGAQTLQGFYASATAAEIVEIKEQLRKHFALDALLANYDVAGAGNDNILIHQGVAYRVDNGGSLRFRAMGAPKGAGFGDKVAELDSMRDPAINGNTAAIFAGISDRELKGQVIDLFGRKAEIMAALPPELRDKVSNRLDDMVKRFWITEAELAPPAPAAGAATYLPADVGAKVAKARINGRGILGDAGDVEDLQTLTWQEKDIAGDAVTRVHLKATFDGAQRIIATVGESVLANAPELPGLKFDAGGYSAAPSAAQLAKIHPKDQFFNALEKAAKTTATHAADGAYNAATMAEFAQAKATLAALAKDQSLDSQGQKMVGQYLGYVKAIEDAQAKTGPLPAKGQFTQYVYTPPKAGTAPAPATAGFVRPAEGEIAVYRDNAHFETKTIVNGNAQVVPGYANEVLRTQSTPVYRIFVGPDVEIKFVRPNGARTRSDNLALQGSIDISVRGGATRESIAKAHDALKRIGIDLAPPTPERLELVYLARGVFLMEKSKTPAGFKAILDGPGSEAEKVKQAKKWIAKKYKVALPDKPTADYQPAGKPNTFGEGFHVWHRFDLPPAKIEAEMKGFAAWHATSRPVHDVVDSILGSGGEFTNTTMRLRKGISIGTRAAPIGMSPYQDLDTGGASYFFTRLRAPGNQNGSGFYFKVRNLARIDAVTFTGDEYGAIDEFGKRKTDVAEYKAIAARGANDETIFKNGVNLLDEVEFIKTSGPAERKAVLDVFKKHGYTVLPDGRKIDDIVK